MSDENHIPIATPEKALIDFLYLSPAKTKQFHSLPELSLSKTFNVKLAQEYISHIPSQRTKSLVSKKFDEISIP